MHGRILPLPPIVIDL